MKIDTKNNSGLTLVELLITLAVLAIVTALAVPIINSVIINANIAAKATEIKLGIEFVERWDSAGAELTYPDDSIIATFDGIQVEYINMPEGYTLVGTGTESDPYVLTINFSDPNTAKETETVTDSSGTLSDGEGTTFVRDATGVTIATTSANWESMTFIHTENGPTETNTVTKKMSNGTTVGQVTKISNTEVRITVAESSTFSFGIVYNGGSTGSYTFS